LAYAGIATCQRVAPTGAVLHWPQDSRRPQGHDL